MRNYCNPSNLNDLSFRNQGWPKYPRTSASRRRVIDTMWPRNPRNFAQYRRLLSREHFALILEHKNDWATTRLVTFHPRLRIFLKHFSNHSSVAAITLELVNCMKKERRTFVVGNLIVINFLCTDAGFPSRTPLEIRYQWTSEVDWNYFHEFFSHSFF